jgi:hypothetical protein
MVLYETRLARNMWQHVTLQQSDLQANVNFYSISRITRGP